MDFSHIDQITQYTEIDTLCDLMEYCGKQIEMEEYYLESYRNSVYVEVGENPTSTPQQQPQAKPAPTANPAQNAPAPVSDQQQTQPTPNQMNQDQVNQSQNKIAQAAVKLWDWIKKAFHNISNWFKNVWDKIINKVQKRDIDQANADFNKTDKDAVSSLEAAAKKAAEDASINSGQGSEIQQNSYQCDTEGSYCYQEALGALALKLGIAAGKSVFQLALDFITAGAFNYIAAGEAAVNKNTVRNSAPIKTYRNIKYEANNAINIANYTVGASGVAPIFKGDVSALFKFDPVTNTVFNGMLKVPKSFNVIFSASNFAATTIFAMIVDWVLQTHMELKDGRNNNNNIIDAAFETAMNNMQRVVDAIAKNSGNIVDYKNTLFAAATEKDIEKQAKALEDIDNYFRGQGLLKIANDVEWTTKVQARHMDMMHKAMNALDANLNDRNSMLGKLMMGVGDKLNLNNLPNTGGSVVTNDTLTTSLGFSDKAHFINEHSWATKILVPLIRNTTTLFKFTQGLTQAYHDFWCFVQQFLNIWTEYHHANIDQAAKYGIDFLEPGYDKEQWKIAHAKSKEALNEFIDNPEKRANKLKRLEKQRYRQNSQNQEDSNVNTNVNTNNETRRPIFGTPVPAMS